MNLVIVKVKMKIKEARKKKLILYIKIYTLKSKVNLEMKMKQIEELIDKKIDKSFAKYNKHIQKLSMVTENNKIVINNTFNAVGKLNDSIDMILKCLISLQSEINNEIDYIKAEINILKYELNIDDNDNEYDFLSI